MDTKALCLGCQREFIINRPWQKFCSAYCRNAWHNKRRSTKPVIIIDELPNENNLSKRENNA
jgi:hypothetical protein